jgi:hypothetical protein
MCKIHIFDCRMLKIQRLFLHLKRHLMLVSSEIPVTNNFLYVFISRLWLYTFRCYIFNNCSYFRSHKVEFNSLVAARPFLMLQIPLQLPYWAWRNATKWQCTVSWQSVNYKGHFTVPENTTQWGRVLGIGWLP